MTLAMSMSSKGILLCNNNYAYNSYGDTTTTTSTPNVGLSASASYPQSHSQSLSYPHAHSMLASTSSIDSLAQLTFGSLPFVSTVAPVNPVGLPQTSLSYAQSRAQIDALKTDDAKQAMTPNTVTINHKQWLTEFAARRHQKKLEIAAEILKLKKQQEKLSERAQKIRNKIRGITTQHSESNNTLTLKQSSRSNASKTVSAKDSVSKKPGWARTEADEDDLFENEAKALLEFVDELNDESLSLPWEDDKEEEQVWEFVNEHQKRKEEDQVEMRNLELEQERIQQIRTKLEYELQAECEAENAARLTSTDKTWMEPSESTERTRNISQELAQILNRESMNTNTRPKTANETKEPTGQEFNHTIQDVTKTFRQIHSHASARAIVDREIKYDPPVSNTTTTTATIPTVTTAISPPQISIITNNADRSKKINAQNLPYLYRHPAI